MIFQIWKTTYTRDQAEHYSADNCLCVDSVFAGSWSLFIGVRGTLDITGDNMTHEHCGTCEHEFQVDPCNRCIYQVPGSGSYDDEKRARANHWTPDEDSRSLIALGRRAGIEEAAKALSERNHRNTDDPDEFILRLLEAK